MKLFIECDGIITLGEEKGIHNADFIYKKISDNIYYKMECKLYGKTKKLTVEEFNQEICKILKGEISYDTK